MLNMLRRSFLNGLIAHHSLNLVQAHDLLRWRWGSKRRCLGLPRRSWLLGLESPDVGTCL